LVLVSNALGNGALEKKHLDDGLKTDPNNFMLHRFKAFSHLKDRDIESAKLEFRKVIELNPKDWDSMNRLGALLIQEGKQDEALRLLRRSLSINGNQPRLKETLRRFGN